MLPITMDRAFIDRWTRMPHSIGRLSASASSHHSLSSAAFIINTAESDFRYTHGLWDHPSPAPRGATATNRAAAAGKAAAERASIGKTAGRSRPGGVRRPRAPRCGHGKQDRPAATASGRAWAAEVTAPHHTAYDHDQYNPAQDKDDDVQRSGVAVGTLLGALLPILCVARQNLNDVVDPAGDAAGEISGLETRQDGILNDQLGDRIS